MALLDELGVKDLKLVAYWDILEPEEAVYDFASLDWQMEQAEKEG